MPRLPADCSLSLQATAAMKGWITGKAALMRLAAIYAGEDNMTQGGVDLTGLASKSNAAITEAFDEPLNKEAVLSDCRHHFIKNKCKLPLWAQKRS